MRQTTSASLIWTLYDSDSRRLGPRTEPENDHFGPRRASSASTPQCLSALSASALVPEPSRLLAARPRAAAASRLATRYLPQTPAAYPHARPDFVAARARS